ncbi:predicted protein [Plenodomus lingam JN3]|uniref:Predicted protein n=1 Tax=Leptosphaeria maculans (strain JN3 / isolate v23.1.3 / race Av1-4-5-6-7-8) TaxID=985895 RepID=E4ZPZ7_LEPMJ|nr:predicted protein [Plenodomus lingam JN3]CBX93532.1 predicted protein [Plenodomus lingam JN3]
MTATPQAPTHASPPIILRRCYKTTNQFPPARFVWLLYAPPPFTFHLACLS